MLMPDWDTLVSWISLLSKGAIVTIQISAISIVLTIILGAISSIGSVSPNIWVRAIVRIFVDIFRSVPILALMIIFYFVVGTYSSKLGISTNVLAIAALTLSSAAYLSEIYRGAMLSVPRSQWRAAESLGLAHGNILRRVIIPQVIPPLVPATLNIVITIVKNSALASLITVHELTLSATMAVSMSFMPLPVYFLLGVFYVALILPLIFLAGKLEKMVHIKYGLISADIKTSITAGRSYSTSNKAEVL